MSHHKHPPHRNDPGHARGRQARTRAPAPGSPQAADGHNPIPGWLFGTVMLFWWIGGYGAVVYSVIEDQGPFTFLLNWQTALFGGFNVILAAGIGAVVVFLGPSLLLHVLRRLWPGNAVIADLDSQMRRSTRSRGEIAADARRRWDDADMRRKRASRAAPVMAALFLRRSPYSSPSRYRSGCALPPMRMRGSR